MRLKKLKIKTKKEARPRKRPSRQPEFTSIHDGLDKEVQHLLGNLYDRMLVVSRREGFEQRDCFNDYSILQQVPTARKSKVVELAREVAILDRAMGSMCGMGIGDAMGHMFEFLDAQDEPGEGPDGSFFCLKSMQFHGEIFNSFNLKLGQWTDDASMGLCMADSLILRQGYDGSDMRIRFWCWWYCGYNNAFRLDRRRFSKASVGLGGNIGKSLRAMKAGRKPASVFRARGEDAGNGSLMRFAPIAIFCHGSTLEQLYEMARQSSYTTHPGMMAAEACSLLAHLIYRALHR
jgi:ADP-ribosylglycohydrolase